MVDISKLNAKTSKGEAVRKAHEFVREGRNIRSVFDVWVDVIAGRARGPEDSQTPNFMGMAQNKGFMLCNDAYIAASYRLTDQPRAAFLHEIGGYFGGAQVSIFGKSSRNDYYSMVDTDMDAVKWAKTGEKKNQHYLPVTSIVMVPIMNHVVLDAETYTYSWQVFTQESSTRGSETAIEIYQVTEFSIKIPIVEILSFDSKTGEKTSHRELSRDESAKVSRAGKSISKSYVVKKLARNCLFISPPTPSMIVIAMAAQTGYLIERKEVGDTIGPFWPYPNFEGQIDEMAAYKAVSNKLAELQESSASDIAKRAALQR